MDQEALVTSGHELVRLFDQTVIKPRAAMWVFNPDLDVWRLWIVPAANNTNKQEFYRIASDLISKNRDKMQGLDVSSVELKDEKHPAMVGMSRVIRMEGLGSGHFSNNRFNDFYLPDGIVLRMAF
jgi:hypothetical protein